MTRVPFPQSAAILTALLVASAVFAGCAGEATDALDLPIEDVGSDGIAAGAITAESEVRAPTWKVADWVGHHVFVPSEGGVQDFHINAIVVDDAGSAYKVVTDDPTFAKLHAIIDIPFFGMIQKDDLSSTGLGTEWGLYEFPLRVNKTWTKQFQPPTAFEETAPEPVRVNYRVSFAPEIKTALGEVFPGFQIVGALDNGTVVFEYDYVPAIGSYAHFLYYRYQTADPTDYEFHATNMGFGENWTGTYYEATATELIQEFAYAYPNPASPASGVGPNPHHTITVGEGTTSLMGFIFAYALSGTAEAVLIDPSNNMYEQRAVNTESPQGGAGTYAQCDGGDAFFCEFPAVPGDWQVGMGGAAVAHFTGVFLWEIAETSGSL